VGERVVVPLPDLVLEPQVMGPGGDPVRSRIDGTKLVFTPEEAGAYVLQLESAPPLAWVAVNTDPIESDVRSYDSVANVERELDPSLLTRRVDLGRQMLSLGLLGLALSSVLALRGEV
jgi:hypothetical protein